MENRKPLNERETGDSIIEIAMTYAERTVKAVNRQRDHVVEAATQEMFGIKAPEGPNLGSDIRDQREVIEIVLMGTRENLESTDDPDEFDGIVEHIYDEFGFMLPADEVIYLRADCVRRQKEYALSLLRNCTTGEEFKHQLEYAESYICKLEEDEWSPIWADIIRDELKRGRYRFFWDGKQLEWVTGEYAGKGQWAISVKMPSAPNIKNPPIMQCNYPPERVAVDEVNLEAMLWGLACMYAASHHHPAFLDPSRPRVLTKERIG